MDLNELENKSGTSAPVEPAASPRLGESSLSRLGDLFRRDLFCWPLALLKYWWLIVALPVVLGICFYTLRAILTPKLYSSSCALVRQEVTDIRHSGLPAGYASAQRSVLFNLIRSRSCLTEAARRLKLDIPYGRLFNSIVIQQAEKNSNYFFISATTGDPMLSANLANTVAEVFLEDYKKFIRTNLELACDSSIRNQNALKEELDVLQQRLKHIYDTNSLSSIEQEIANTSQRLLLVEDRQIQAQNQIASLESRIRDYEVQLKTIPKEVVVYSERSTAREQTLTQMKLALEELRQRYTEENPRVQKQKRLVEAMEKEMQSKDDGYSKIVNGRNAEYTNTQVELTKAKASVTALKISLGTYTETLVKLRARRDMLNRLTPEVNLLREQIDQKKNMLLKQDSIVKELQLFLERSYSDVSIQEPASPTRVSLPRRLGRFLLIGFALGLILSCGIALLRELFNLTVRSKIDMEDALHIPAMGIVPVFSHDLRADFYSALQIAVSNAEDLLGSSKKKPIMIAIAPLRHEDLSTSLLNDFCEILKVRNDLSYRIIRMTESGGVENGDAASFLINDFLYYQSLAPFPKAGKDQTLYFKLDDLAFISPPPERNLAMVREAVTDCDVVIWELFEFELHRQLFSEVCKAVDMTVIPFRYGISSKWEAYQLLRQLHAFKVSNVTGLLYNVSNKIYRRVSL